MCKKRYMLAMIGQRVPMTIEDKLELILVDPANAKPDKLTSCCLNFQLLKIGLAKLDDKKSRGEQLQDVWDYFDTNMRAKLLQSQKRLSKTV